MNKIVPQNANYPDTNLSYLTLRKALGIMGLTLPFALIIVNNFEIKTSISHFYYSNSSVVFTGFMFAFGIFLISYRGRVGDNVGISDNYLTSIAGAAAIITAIIPTAFCSDYPQNIEAIYMIPADCNCGVLTTQPIHNKFDLGIIHLMSAGLFLALMGYMSFFRFTKGGNVPVKKVWLYRVCGAVVWLSILFLIFDMWLEFTGNDYIVLICEWIALSFFGFAWMIKGKTFDRQPKAANNPAGEAS